MMLPPPTLDERLEAVGSSMVVAAAIFVISNLIHAAISKGNERKRIQGKFVGVWMAFGFLAGAVYGAIVADNVRYYLTEVVYGAAGFSLLLGWVFGMFHGWIRLQVPDASVTKEKSGHKRDSPNPYLPPDP